MTVTAERVVLATDGSAAAATAAAHALFLAGVLDAPLHVVSATGVPSTAASGTTETETAGPSASAAVEAEEAVGAVTRRALLAGVRLTSAVVGGPAAAAVERAVGDGDLLVLGRHGRSGPGRFLVGSVAERVLDAPPVPTLVVPSASPRPTYRRIALFADDVPSAEPAATFARRIAAATRGVLEPLAVIDERAVETASPDTRRTLETEARGRVNAVAAAAARDAVESGGTVRTGVPAAELLAHVERTGADVVVVGVDGADEAQGGGDRTARTVAGRIVRHVGVPALVVPSAGDGDTIDSPGRR
ncbi:MULTISPECIES: universal stress protein [unclassified Haloferax]|uniref:universal stress protein n=1 Tax=unclassified Haloferax TaxID=2625095 RepID=UPI002874AAF7|nr:MULTISPECIES: universal stress protein [unclassified Haloferax]MDS0241203.1 universal stress protein [Haloferax sp. S2CR25]MDS0444324.1 universal stress protein [Haloferax sp. S2CR25-2]